MILHTVQPYKYACLYVLYIHKHTQGHHFINYYLNNCKQICKKHIKPSFIYFSSKVVGKHSNCMEAKILLKTMLMSKSDRHVIDTFEAVAGLPATQSNQF